MPLTQLKWFFKGWVQVGVENGRTKEFCKIYTGIKLKLQSLGIASPLSTSNCDAGITGNSGIQAVDISVIVAEAGTYDHSS